MVVKRGREHEVEDIFGKWDLHAVKIGEVTSGNRLVVKVHGVVAADIPNRALTDEAPVYLDSRTLSLRGFGADGLLKDGMLAMPGEADAKIRALFERPEVAIIHAHAATYGCFLARIERN